MRVASEQCSTPMRQGLTRPDLVMGCDRIGFGLLLILGTTPVMLGFQKLRLDWILIGCVALSMGFAALRRLAADDPQLVAVWLRSQKFARKVSAVGRWDCRPAHARNSTGGGPKGAGAERGVAEHLMYECLGGADGSVVLLRDGSLLGGIWFEGPDLEGTTPAQISAPGYHFAAAAKALGEGWTVQQESIIRADCAYLPNDEGFADAVDKAIDDERRGRADHLVTSDALFLTYKRPRLQKGRAARATRAWVRGASFADVLGKLRATLAEGDDPEAREDLRLDLKAFERGVGELMEGLGRGGIRSRWMGVQADNHELLQALNYVVNGVFHKVRAPENGWHVAELLAHDLLRDPSLTYADKHVSIVTPMQFPPKSRPAMLEHLRALGVELRWSTRFICQDAHTSRRLLQAHQTEWKKKRKGAAVSLKKAPPSSEDLVDEDAAQRMQEMSAALGDLESGVVAYGHLTQVVVITSESRAKCNEAAKAVRKVFGGEGFTTRVEQQNDVEALLGSFPGHAVFNVRRPVVNTMNFADLVSLSREWEGDRRCPFASWGRSPWLQGTSASGGAFYVNTHDGDVGHTLIVGRPGSGKSTLAALMMSQHGRYKNSQVFAFDVGRSLEPLARARRDSAHYVFGDEESPQLCPLAEIDTKEQQAWAETWIQGLFAELGLVLTEQERGAIRTAIRDLAQETSSAEERTLTDYWFRLQGARLKSAFEYYTQGPGARVLNGTSTSLRKARFVVFEVEKLLNGPLQVCNPTLLYLFRWVESRLDGSPSVLLLDEAWKALGNAVFGPKVGEYLRTFRKKSCAVVLATQSPQDVAGSSIAAALLASCPTRILCPTPEAQNPVVRAAYVQGLGLSPAVVDQVVNMTPQQEYLWVRRNRVRRFSLNLSPFELAFCGSGRPEDLRTQRELQARHGHWWPREWLKQKGLSEGAKRWERALLATGEIARGGESEAA